MALVSPTALSRLRNRAADWVEQMFSTVVEINGVTIAASRVKSVQGVQNELTGLLPSADLTVRILRKNIPESLVIQPQRTRLNENGKSFRVEQIHESVGDPAIVLVCKAA